MATQAVHAVEIVVVPVPPMMAPPQVATVAASALQASKAIRPAASHPPQLVASTAPSYWGVVVGQVAAVLSMSSLAAAPATAQGGIANVRAGSRA